MSRDWWSLNRKMLLTFYAWFLRFLCKRQIDKEKVRLAESFSEFLEPYSQFGITHQKLIADGTNAFEQVVKATKVAKPFLPEMQAADAVGMVSGMPNVVSIIRTIFRKRRIKGLYTIKKMFQEVPTNWLVERIYHIWGHRLTGTDVRLASHYARPIEDLEMYSRDSMPMSI